MKKLSLTEATIKMLEREDYVSKPKKVAYIESISKKIEDIEDYKNLDTLEKVNVIKNLLRELWSNTEDNKSRNIIKKLLDPFLEI